MKRASIIVAILGGLAEAGTSTSNMGVTANVASTCSITAGTLAFGTYDTVSGAQVDGSATLSVACTRGALTTITLGQGANPATGSTDAIPQRRMKDASTDMLSYTLYTDATRLLAWGNTALTGAVFTPLSSSPQNVTVFGRIAASQDVPAGSYTDVVVATISF
jgi:spore coat protein U-like protein